MLERLRVSIIEHGLHAEHNMPCAVCWNASAVYQMGDGIFQPCWGCQKKGYRLVKNRANRRLYRKIIGN